MTKPPVKTVRVRIAASMRVDYSQVVEMAEDDFNEYTKAVERDDKQTDRTCAKVASLYVDVMDISDDGGLEDVYIEKITTAER